MNIQIHFHTIVKESCKRQWEAYHLLYCEAGTIDLQISLSSINSYGLSHFFEKSWIVQHVIYCFLFWIQTQLKTSFFSFDIKCKLSEIYRMKMQSYIRNNFNLNLLNDLRKLDGRCSAEWADAPCLYNLCGKLVRMVHFYGEVLLVSGLQKPFLPSFHLFFKPGHMPSHRAWKSTDL